MRTKRPTGRSRIIVLLVIGLVGPACAGRRPAASFAANTPPAFMEGDFVDDYGIRYTITADVWIQHPDTRYHIQQWHALDRFLIARNEANNPGGADLWTRIDWTRLEEGGEYEWAFCYAAYDARDPREAVDAPPTNRATPRVGCNGYPFSRMKRVSTIELRETGTDELEAIAAIEQAAGNGFVLAWSVARHLEEHARDEVEYRSIYRGAQLIGFVILVLDSDGVSVEFRRVVISEQGHGHGTAVITEIHELARSQFARRRMWLDVFEENARARHVYEKLGYRPFGRSEHDGRTLIVYEKDL